MTTARFSGSPLVGDVHGHHVRAGLRRAAAIVVHEATEAFAALDRRPDTGDEVVCGIPRYHGVCVGASGAREDERMDPLLKDWIDTISKVVGFVGVATAAGMAAWQVRKARLDRIDQANQAQADRAKEIETRRINLGIAKATFWLTLRQMFAEHHEVHVALRPQGTWANGVPKDVYPKIETYMGLFEHCQRMLEDQLIDFETFKKIYAYRIENIVRNADIVRYKLMDRAIGWTDFIRLVVTLDLWPTLEKMEQHWLADPEVQVWRDGPYGQEWRKVMKKEFDIEVGEIVPRGQAHAP